MENYNKKIFEMVLRIGKGTVLFIIGSIVIHTVIIIFDYFLVPEPLYLNLRQNFVNSIFSTPMLPMMTAYGALFLLIYSLWMRANKALRIVYQKEIQREKVEIIFKAMQQITGIIAEHVATNNAVILGWVEFRKSQGQKVSSRIEKPARNITNALRSLSEFSFIAPYTDNIPKDAEDIEELLKSRLDIKVN